MHHMLAWRESVAQDAEADIAPVTDGIWTIQTTHFLPQSDWFLQAIYEGSADPVRARLRTPSFRQITTPFIRPIGTAIVPTDDPNVADYRSNPLRFRGLEEIEFLAEHTAVGAAVVVGVAAVSRGALLNMPQGDVYTLRATSTTTLTAGAWTQAAQTFQDTLPQGIFSVVGGWIQGATAIAFRLIFEDQIDRPGGLGAAALGSRAAPLFRMGGLGIWGRFNSNRMPNVEILANAADTSAELYLDIIRVG